MPPPPPPSQPDSPLCDIIVDAGPGANCIKVATAAESKNNLLGRMKFAGAERDGGGGAC